MDRAIAAIFDLDGTLLNGHVWLAVSQYHKLNRINRRWLYFYLLAHMPFYYLQRLHLMDVERSRYLWARNMGWSLRGFNQAQAMDLFEWVADEYIMPQLRQDVVRRLRHHQAQGHRTILLSGAFDGLLDVVGERLGVDGALGTRLKQRNGRYVGSPLPPVCQGKGKVERLQAYLSASSEGIDLAASYAYADSLTDQPVLELVGHPVAVYPEENLATLADRRGWSILGTVS